MNKLLICLTAAAILAGCSSSNTKPIPDDPYYAPVYPEAPPTKIAATGSVYQDSQASSLYSDIKALKVGDIITVILMEETQASKALTTKSRRELT